MKVALIYLTILSALLDNIAANPLLGNETLARTFSQQNMKCNTRSTVKRITFSNSFIFDPNAQNCAYTIRAFSTKVCQLRIDFLFLDMEQPSKTTPNPYAHCAGDRLSINGLNFDLCGRLVNQHVYIPFDVKKITDEVVLDFKVSSNSFAMWNMEVNQIECGHKAALVTPDERQAPDGCLQYFYQTAGSVESFNFGDNYLGDTAYAICFNRNYVDNAMLELTEITFSMDGTPGTPPLGFDAECLDPTGAAPKKDYIAIPFAEVTDQAGVTYHNLFCLDSIHTKQVEFKGTGPMVIHVNTDKITDNPPNKESGFRFRYRIKTQ